MNLSQLAFANVRAQPLTSTLNIGLLALGTATIVFLLLLSHHFSESLTRDARGIDLVIGAKGSPVQLVLSSVYHADIPTGNIPLAKAQTWANDRRIAKAIPLALGDSARGKKGHATRIVGTSHDYPKLYDAQLVQGEWWDHPLEAVLGAEAAQRTELTLGATFAGAHGIGGHGDHHEQTPYRVVGIMAATGTVLDSLILTSLESVWAVHGDHGHDVHHEQESHDETDEHAHEKEPHGDNHEQEAHSHHEEHDDHQATEKDHHEPHHGDEEHEAHDHEEEHGHQEAEDAHHDHEKHEGEDHAHEHHDEHGDDHVTGDSDKQNEGREEHDDGDDHGSTNSVELAEDHSDREITAMLMQYRSPISAVSMPRQINSQSNLQAAAPAFELARLLKLIGVGLDALRAFALILIASAAFSIFGALYAALRGRRGELAIMRCMGGTRTDLMICLLIEGLILGVAGVLIGLLIGHGTVELLGQALASGLGRSISGTHFLMEELFLVGGLLIVVLLAAALPAWQAYRTDVAQALSGSA